MRTVRGLYQIVDGGYHQWRVLQSPLKWTSDPHKARWSKQLESVRKDVECVFGSLKGRFRILKIPILFHKIHQIVNIFYTCCVLHNMLLTNDGLDVPSWETDVDWKHLDGLLGVREGELEGEEGDDEDALRDEAADAAQVAPGNTWGMRPGNQEPVQLNSTSDLSVFNGFSSTGMPTWTLPRSVNPHIAS